MDQMQLFPQPLPKTPTVPGADDGRKNIERWSIGMPH